MSHTEGDGSMQAVVDARTGIHTSVSMNPQVKTHYWLLTLACGHRVERWIRWKPAAQPQHGYAAMHHAPGLDRLPDPPKRARCAEEKRGNFR